MCLPPPLSRLRFDFEDGLEAAIRQEDNTRREQRTKRKRTVCKHWMRGLCTMGADCTFLHELRLDRIAVCSFYREGRCTAGEKCKFRHVGTIATAVPDHAPKPKPNPDDEFMINFSDDSDSD